MDVHTQDKLRTELTASKQDLITELKRLGADPASGKVRQLGDVDDNFADSASATAERSEKLTLIEQANERLADVDHALARMDEGAYGVCEHCGREISASRLEARPMSVLCVACAAAA
jgi:DnaK suppressor protein